MTPQQTLGSGKWEWSTILLSIALNLHLQGRSVCIISDWKTGKIPDTMNSLLIVWPKLYVLVYPMETGYSLCIMVKSSEVTCDFLVTKLVLWAHSFIAEGTWLISCVFEKYSRRLLRIGTFPRGRVSFGADSLLLSFGKLVLELVPWRHFSKGGMRTKSASGVQTLRLCLDVKDKVF